MAALPAPNGMMASPQPMNPPVSLPQQPAAPDPRAWAKNWQRPEEWTDDYLIDKFGGWDKTDNAHWTDWKDEARLCYDITAGHQWDKDAEADARDKSLTIVTINKVDATVSAICGSEMSNRHDVKFFPREASSRGPDGKLSDVVVNEILTAAAEWVRDECDAADEESEAFRDVIVCGLGVTETAMSYEVDPEGMAIVQRCDPLEFRIDASSRRPNAADARRITREKPFTKEDAKDKFGVTEGGKQPSWAQSPHANDPGQEYKGRALDQANKDDVWIKEYQWWELERVHKVVNPLTGVIEELSHEEFEKLIGVMPELERDSASIRVRRYYRAFVCGDQVLEVTPLPDEEFTYKVITGKLDRNAGVWYGVVRAMTDPQRLLNKQISQIQRIIDTNAKGGLLAETDAVEDVQQFEDEWAASNTISWAKTGAVSQGKIIPKPIANYPAGIDKLLMIANEAVPGTSGVNNEMLGLIDREQAGVVDVTRKEAAYGVLMAFFNSLRRYRKEHGRHLLKLITRYMSNNRLIRIIGRNGNVQYVPLAKQPDTARFDVIVDQAPTGPNQKDKVFAFLMAMAPMLSRMNLPPQVLLKFLEFSPLPTALVSEVMQEVQKIPPQQDPAAQKAQHEMQMGQMKLAMDGQKAQSDATIKMQTAQFEAQMAAQTAQAELQLEREKSAAQLRQQEEMSRVQAAIEEMKAQQTAAIAERKAERELMLAEAKQQMEAMFKERQMQFEMQMMEREQAFNERMTEKEVNAGIATDHAKANNTQFGGEVG